MTRGSKVPVNIEQVETNELLVLDYDKPLWSVAPTEQRTGSWIEVQTVYYPWDMYKHLINGRFSSYFSCVN